MKILKDKLFKFMVIFFALLILLPLFSIIFMIFKNGFSVINLEFLTTLPKPPGETGGGVLNGIVGTLLLVFFASLIAIPLGLIAGIFLYEYREKKIGEVLTTFVDISQGVPSIVVGIISYLWIVKRMGHFSLISGSFALSLIFLPIVAKSTKETLKMIPVYIIEASLSLGVSYPRTILKVVLPFSIGGILSGILLGISRISGETAPLLFTAFGNPFLNFNILKPVSSLPLLIFVYAISPYDNWRKYAWGCSLILVIFVSLMSFLNKLLLKKWKIKF
jgi:phosphate transport system permease protein